MGFEKASRRPGGNSKKGRAKRFMERHGHHSDGGGKEDYKSDSEDEDRENTVYSDGGHGGKEGHYERNGAPTHKNQKSNMDYIVNQIPEEKEKVVCVAHFRTNSAGIFTLSDTMDPLAKLSVKHCAF